MQAEAVRPSAPCGKAGRVGALEIGLADVAGGGFGKLRGA
jgi:hypothetical protein